MIDIRSVGSVGPAGRMCTLPKPHPREFRDDVVAVARRGVQISLVGKDFGISGSAVIG